VKYLHIFWHRTLRRPHKLSKVIDSGDGHTVLLIHGLAANSHTWQPLVDVVDTSKWRLVAFDLLGFGASPKPDYVDYDVTDHARFILASLDRETKRKGIIIIGHSMGCLVASHIAWLEPRMVKHMILYEPPLFADSPEFRSHVRRRRLYFALYEELIKRPSLLMQYSKVVNRISEGRAIAVNQDTLLPFERSLKNTIMKQQAYNELKAVEVPTDIIYGKFDLIVTRSDVKNMLATNENVKFHLVNEMHDINKRAANYIKRLLIQL
jgi:pimeloyl-ACP methyl ester carboxylesterase